MQEDRSGCPASAMRMTQAEYFSERSSEVDAGALRDEIKRIVGGMAAKGKLRDAPEIDDIVSEVWLRFWRSPNFGRLTNQGPGIDRERALYVAAIARNWVANERHRRRRRPDLFRMPSGAEKVEPRDHDLSPSETAATNSALRRWLAGLTTRRRTLLGEMTTTADAAQPKEPMSSVRRVRIFRLIARFLSTIRR